jgi:prephenate dehydratase
MADKIAIQGYRASFHEEAAIKFFVKTEELVECLSFQKLFDTLAVGEADVGVMAIENSVAGSILPNYARLRDSMLQIVGEVYLRIEMNFMALPGQRLEDIREVHSHPIAILQTHNFFREHPHILAVESDDTAYSALQIAKEGIRGRGALASKRAAELYGLEILQHGVETNKRNFTRFLILQPDYRVGMETINKASWSFRTAHKSGSLAKALTILGEHGVNLTKIQSLPVLGEEWKYYFYADLEFSDGDAYREVKKTIRPHIYDLKILGEYKQGEKYL